MPRHFCGTCRAPLHREDGHSECVGCLGKPHAEGALSGASYPHCERMSLGSLRLRAAFFNSDPTDHALPSASGRLARKRQRGREVQRPEPCELTSARVPACPAFSHRRTVSEQRPSADASDLVAFGASDEEPFDDSMSLAASNEAEGWTGESEDPVPLPSLEPIDHSTGMDAELFRVLSKAVEELDLEWAPPEEPSRSRLDEWFLPGSRRQSPRQRSAPFFPEVHEELTKSWRAPYSARLHTITRSALTTVDGSDAKGYEHLPPLDEAVAAHLFPPAAKSSQAMRHFLPKRSSSASAPNRPRPAPAQQTKPAPSTSQAASPKDRQRSRSAKRSSFPRRQGPWPRIVLDPVTPKSS
ncbi:hypothetical protein DPX16_12180 [Anabarilius grahami]|uniref:Uncharacterized protein n=1 Tax=Anabarilius grahami TaxID=495550 RepID=A0A3N0YQX2_ANAGA|nr:hypothetical protein DPX16_12180 [Anabarilius grahami]